MGEFIVHVTAIIPCKMIWTDTTTACYTKLLIYKGACHYMSFVEELGDVSHIIIAGYVT